MTPMNHRNMSSIAGLLAASFFLGNANIAHAQMSSPFQSGGMGTFGSSGSGFSGSTTTSQGQGFRPAAGTNGLNRPGGLISDPFGGTRSSPLQSAYGTNGGGFGGSSQFGGGQIGGLQGSNQPYGNRTTGRTGGFISTGNLARYAQQENFRPVPPAVMDIRTRLTGMVNNTFPPVSGRKISVSLDGDALVLMGIVASETEKQFVSAMVRLEPGVYEVRNELEVKRLQPAEEPPRSPSSE